MDADNYSPSGEGDTRASRGMGRPAMMRQTTALSWRDDGPWMAHPALNPVWRFGRKKWKAIYNFREDDLRGVLQVVREA